MTEKKGHSAYPHLSGEHPFGDAGQLILFVVFLGVWITDSFIFHYSTFLHDQVPNYLRIAIATPVLLTGWFLARRGMKKVFGTERDKPELIQSGVFRFVRHPIYTGALLLYLGLSLMTISLASGALFLLIIAFYYYICRYEERLLSEEFGEDYLQYKKKTCMLFPRLRPKRD